MTPRRPKHTSAQVATIAGRILRDPRASADAKRVAASALAQAGHRR